MAADTIITYPHHGHGMMLGFVLFWLAVGSSPAAALARDATSFVLFVGHQREDGTMRGQRRRQQGRQRQRGWLSSSHRRQAQTLPVIKASADDTTVNNNNNLHQNIDTLHDDSSSWSHLLSSPARYAQMLHLTEAQVEQAHQRRREAVGNLTQYLNQTTISKQERQRAVCQHRYEHGKHPFVCPRCWSYLPICLCPDENTSSLRHNDNDESATALGNENASPLADEISLTPHKSSSPPLSPIKVHCQGVILWTHCDEWGSPSNTGSTLSLTLDRCHVLMKGLHESRLQELVDTKDGERPVLPLVLWPEHPNKNKNNNQRSITTTTAHRYVSPEDLRGQESRILLIVPEGTWRQSRRMVSKLPYPRLSLDLSSSSSSSSSSSTLPTQSLLAPLRKQNGDTLCTAEAVGLALQQLGLVSSDDCSYIWSVAQEKVERTRRYQGKPKRAP